MNAPLKLGSTFKRRHPQTYQEGVERFTACTMSLSGEQGRLPEQPQHRLERAEEGGSGFCGVRSAWAGRGPGRQAGLTCFEPHWPQRPDRWVLPPAGGRERGETRQHSPIKTCSPVQFQASVSPSSEGKALTVPFATTAAHEGSWHLSYSEVSWRGAVTPASLHEIPGTAVASVGADGSPGMSVTRVAMTWGHEGCLHRGRQSRKPRFSEKERLRSTGCADRLPGRSDRNSASGPLHPVEACWLAGSKPPSCHRSDKVSPRGFPRSDLPRTRLP